MTVNKKNNGKLGYGNHGQPVTRRDLFSQGILSLGGYVVTPSLFSLFSSVARGEPSPEQCGSGATKNRMMPLIVIDLSGGSNFAGTNVIVGGRGGQTDFLAATAYNSIGLTPAKAPGSNNVAIVNEFGLSFHPDSKILAGLRTAADAPVRANVDGVLFCAKSGDDSSNNPLNPLFWIVKSGAIGELTSIVGTDSNGSLGGRSAAPASSIDPRIAVQKGINKAEAAAGLVNPGKLAEILSVLSDRDGGKRDADKVLKKIQMISESSMRNFQQKTLPAQVETLINCGYMNAARFLDKFTPQNLNPTLDTTVTQVFPQIATDSAQQAGGTIAKLVLDGFAAGGTIVMGGYDYHGQGRAAQDTKDQDAGRMIGRILKLASLKNTSVMVYVITDGGVSAGSDGGAVNGILPFSSDSGERSAAFALVYRAGQSGRPAIRENRRQIGAYNAAGAVDLTAAPKISGNSETLTKAVVANYLALHGREGELAKVVGDDPFGPELNDYLAFGKSV